MPPLQSCPLPAVQPLLHRVNHPTLAHALHEKAAVKAGVFLSGVDLSLIHICALIKVALGEHLERSI